ncbi:disease resistance protein rpp5 [Quercus suber]|uniref:Disease resistance protein rpp5 n=1 Tax=Quercus suber TaxID=58331 RepID=A0AAW0LHN0_QUESU
MSLMSIVINSCSDLVSISPHQDITSLQSFIIDTCEKLSDLSITWLTLPLLEMFLAINCPNLRSFPSLQGAGSHLQNTCEQLSDLLITWLILLLIETFLLINCPNLRSFPSLQGVGSHLLSLGISCGDECPNLKSIPDLRELYSLTHLSIFNCQTLKLTCLPELLACFTSLKSLKISGFCEELDAFPSLRLSSIQHLHTSLETLLLHGWPKVDSLPDEIQHFTAFKHLFILCFDGLEAFPEWLCNLSSIQRLDIWSYVNLMYLPTLQAMKRLTKLESLTTLFCPKLMERCARGSRVEWSKIANISHFTL